VVEPAARVVRPGGLHDLEAVGREAHVALAATRVLVETQVRALGLGGAVVREAALRPGRRAGPLGVARKSGEAGGNLALDVRRLVGAAAAEGERGGEEEQRARQEDYPKKAVATS
jgi:hypothetical protein